MNVHHLKYFVDAARAESISAAAKANLVTQPGISRAIANLERELGVELIHHRKNRFQLTEAGRALLQQSPQVFFAIQSLRDSASAHAKTLRGPLRVACNQSVASKLLGPILPKIEQRYPHVSLDVKIGNTDQVQHFLTAGEADLGIVLDDGLVGKSFQMRPLYKGRFVLVRKPGGRSRLPHDVLVSRILPGGMSERYANAFERAYQTRFAPKLVIPSWQVIMDLALSGYGCALVPEFLCAEELKRGRLEIVKHKVPPLKFALCAIGVRNRQFSRTAQMLCDLFTKG